MRLVTIIAILSLCLWQMQYACELKRIKMLDTHGGIKSDTQCSYYMYVDEVSGQEHEKIICNDGSEYDRIEQIEGSTTGTPAWLDYANYIGSYQLSKGLMPGAGRQKLFFDGRARRRQISE